jgi:hypothetical protein
MLIKAATCWAMALALAKSFLLDDDLESDLEEDRPPLL